MVPISFHIDTTIDIQLAQLAHVFLMSSIHVSEKKNKHLEFLWTTVYSFLLGPRVAQKKIQEGTAKSVVIEGWW